MKVEAEAGRQGRWIAGDSEDENRSQGRTTVAKLAVSPRWKRYGLRIFGYLHPYIDGEFVFALSSQDNSEFWLSSNASPLRCELLAWVGKTGAEWSAPGEYEKFVSQTSRPVRLSAQKKYFFEVIHKQDDGSADHVEVAWKLNRDGLAFTVINSSHISLYTDESMLLMSDVAHIPQTTASHVSEPIHQSCDKPGGDRPSAKPGGDRPGGHQPWADMLREDPRDTLYQLPLISGGSLRDVLPNCTYKPSYNIKGVRLQRYQGLNFVHLSQVYPNDYTRLTQLERDHRCFYQQNEESLKQYMALDEVVRKAPEKSPQEAAEAKKPNSPVVFDAAFARTDLTGNKCNLAGNLMLQPSIARALVKRFMDKLYFIEPRLSLVRVLNVERRVDPAKGSRYLLELEVKDENGELHRLSHYVYTVDPPKTALPPAEPYLCNPVGIQWKPAVTVHFIVAVKNQARWVMQLIANMEEVYRQTGDALFSLVIVDYDSKDADVLKALKAACLPQYKYLNLSGHFQRAAGLQAGIDLVTDDHSILFLFDLHLHTPVSIVDSVRKHCVEGVMAFAPILMRLDCGATPLEPRGFWEVAGFGLLAGFKSDLMAAGGMNTKEFTFKWGGEDWEFLDRILKSGLEVERLHLRNFFHYFHSKRGMWSHVPKPSKRHRLSFLRVSARAVARTPLDGAHRTGDATGGSIPTQ
ncbi:N-acetyl-beta-glucosaminyl-glycoprotein 4-beta-N-acetylgalactosaminyltransferase 1 [Merluccius polli]|uniref:Beta-1,4-N-acetylgalactosaminyltransferase n=1 Tax=Merluccius polli TaxID=89951 RepID=A0AA47MMG6_MERPO|nr:N-acetyl-beta-glucosaminyl-glycoprotein 4-beta-N-acetylgalactosaminyltransferase 1 [Merluccius polli]